MPSSTAWRRPFGTSDVRFQSPPRPASDAIERLSPEPFPNLRTSTIPHPFLNNRNIQSTEQGLGLSLEHENDAETNFPVSQQLWVDHNGEARIASFGATPNGGYHSRVNSYHEHDNYRVPSRKDNERNRGRQRAHARSGSNIDTLATVALATSPTFTNASPSTPQSSWNTHSYSNGYGFNPEERPAKRARSEKLPSPEWVRKQSERPRTSYVPTQIPTQVSMDEAELLLNFAQNHHRPSLQISLPTNNYVHRSPSYTRLSASTTSSEQAQLSIDENAPLQPSPKSPDLPFNTQESRDEEYAPTADPNISQNQLWAVPEVEDLKPVEQNEDIDPPIPQIPIELVIQEEQKLPPAVQEQDSYQGGEREIGGTAFELPSAELPLVKKPRRVKPTVQATSCAACNLLQTVKSGVDEDSSTFWISCNGCKKWYHSVCAGFKDKREAQTVDKFICPDCESAHGKTTFVRKSSRARTAIDYAGLNEGIVKSSTETPEHHYLQPIKDGKITFQPDEFARIRPELVTSEHFDKTDGMKQPIVIPLCWNPRFGDSGPVSADEVAEPAVIELEGSDGIRNVPTRNGKYVELEEVIDCDQDLLDMVMPRDLTVRKVSELYGPDEPLEVIDVKSQSQGVKKWNMHKWADYYESTDEKIIRNVISLEVSQSRLGKLIRRPKIVRDIDLQDSVWPAEMQAVGDFPKVQFYCLMSVADCYTDFHIDFGGSSVYYHILKGKKTFFFIPPEDKNLKAYENWCNSETQDTTWLGDVTGDCSRVDLSEGDTMLIPAGWIHAVWTPEDSLVIGGNFLTRQNYEMQIKVANVERDTKVARKFRYPHFQKIMWYTAMKYLEDDPVPEEVLDDFNADSDFMFRRANPIWHEFGDLANVKEPGDSHFNTRFYSRKEIEGLPALRDYLYRTALIGGGFHVPGVTVDATRNVKRSIPKGASDPLETVKLFGIWCAWKISSVVAPEWTRPDAVALQKLAEKQEKLKQPEVIRTPPERVSSRVASQVEIAARASQEAQAVSVKRSTSSAGYESDEIKKLQTTAKASGLGPKRVACDACRKRRIRCRHKDDGEVPSPAHDIPRPRAYSSMSVDATRPNAVQSSTNVGVSDSIENDYLITDTNAFTTPIIAQEALANADLQNPDTTADASALLLSSSKKGRSKACEECRKSKRRCIHDELGRVDPNKAAEPSKPRGSGTAKRLARMSDEHGTPTAKRPKLEDGTHGSDAETILVGQAQSALAAELGKEHNGQPDFDSSLIDPALTMDIPSAPPQQPQPILGDAVQQLRAATDALTRSTKDMTASRNPAGEPAYDPEVSQPMEPTPVQCEPGSDHKLPDLPHTDASPKAQSSLMTMPNSSGQAPAGSLASPPDSLLHDPGFSPTAMASVELTKSIEINGEGSESSGNPLHTPKSSSRYSSRQPKQVDRYVPDIANTLHELAPDNATYDRRASSSAASALTSLDGKSRRSSNVSVRSGPIPEASTTPAFKAESPASQSRGMSRGRSSFGDPEMDEESLKLIKALQQEDLGLRRRGGKA